MNMLEAYERDARQVIVKALAGRDDLTLNTTMLDHALRQFGVNEPPEWIFDQLAWLERMGVVSVAVASASTRVATLTEKGVNHVLGKRKIEGIGRPSLASLGLDLISQGLKQKIGE
ncbi:MAG: hypothetical protein KGL46_03940 [Hyphomicrobiales bacterium]|nr:hypothetical protein [Hyphomicrobiales bacterium]